MSTDQRNSLPFEPRQKKKKTPKKAPSTPVKAPSSAKGQSTLSAVPEAVSQRMVRRMALFCGVPTALGMLSFVVCYFIVVNEWIDLPSIAVVLVSMGFFGLGVFGLSYGILSASWDENRDGTFWGTQEFSTNLERMLSAWRAAREAKSS
jgi:hypothetical protein